MQDITVIMLFIKLDAGITINNNSNRKIRYAINHSNFKIMEKIILLISILTIVYGFSSVDDNKLIPERPGLLENKFGVWEGVGTQPGISWTIKITLKSNEQLIEYPSLSCGGFLTLISETETKLLFRETITFNTKDCLDQGFIELIETSETTMDYNYFYPNTTNEKGELCAYGSVTKVE
jgi:hypothetical protein